MHESSHEENPERRVHRRQDQSQKRVVDAQLHHFEVQWHQQDQAGSMSVLTTKMSIASRNRKRYFASTWPVIELACGSVWYQ